MLNFYKVLTTILLMCVVKEVLFAQKVFKQNAPNSNCYCEMIFEETAKLPKAVLVIDVKNADIKNYSRDNKYLDLKEDYNILYIKILNKGTPSSMQCYDAVISTISSTDKVQKSAFYVIENSTGTLNPIVKRGDEPIYPFNVIYDVDSDLLKLRRTLNEATLNRLYAIPIATSDLNPEWVKRMENYKGNHDIGIHISPLFLTGTKLGIDKGSISPYGLSYAINISKQSTIKVSLSGLFKLPNTKGLQSGMQSRMLSAIQNGEKSMYLNEKISGQVMFGSDALFKYHLEKTKPFRPYVGVGIGAQMLVSISGALKDTIDISGVSLSNPGSLKDLLGGNLGVSGGDLPDGMIRTNTLFVVPQCEIGFDYRLSPVTKINISMPFKYFVDMSKSGLNTFAFGLNFGLSFTLNPRKFPKPPPAKKAAIASIF